MPISGRLPRIFYGGDYNPEQWPEEVWLQDARLMREAGVNLVSVGIFSWAKLEPRPGEYDFSWLDRVLDILHEHGVMADLATATASPPPWLAKIHPESLPVTADGTTLYPGARQHYCPSSPAYRERAAALARKMAVRYAEHPALAAWHINNEYGCHVAECYCDVSAAAFQRWLQERYGTLDALNEAWGTAFWSQRYSEWAEIPPPRTAPTFANPTQQLDFRRFSSDELLECMNLERDAVREASPDVPITTNFMGLFKPLDYWKWAAEEDFVSHDSYPDPADPEDQAQAFMAFDLMRSLGAPGEPGGKPWVLMEQATTRVNWRERNVPKRPGQMRLWSLSALARGADGIMFFQWRQSKAGAEKFHGAMVPHGDLERSRSWQEVKQLGADLEKLSPVAGSRGEAEVAILLDWNSWWALELDSKPSDAVRQMDGLAEMYRPLLRTNVAVDFAHPESDLSGYRVVLAPNLYLVTDAGAENVRRFVAGGGTLLMTFFSGIADENEHIRLGGYPAPFRELLGVEVEDFVPFAADEGNGIQTKAENTYCCELWADLIHAHSADTLATFTNGFYAGSPAVTRNLYGEGAAYYVGTRPEAAYTATLVEAICRETGVKPPIAAPEGVEAVRRAGGDGTFLFLLNHNLRTEEVALPGSAEDLLSGESHEHSVTLEPFGAAVLRGL